MLKGICDPALMDVPVASVGPRDGSLGLRGDARAAGLSLFSAIGYPDELYARYKINKDGIAGTVKGVVS